MQAADTSTRGRYNAFVDRHEVAWELTMAVLAVVFVLLGFAEESPWVTAADWTLTGIFLAEFSTRFAASTDRRGYLGGHWVDLLALVPAVRGVRVLRLLRLLRLVRAFAGAYRGLQHFERMARHRGLAWLFVTWAGVMVICSLALYAAENGINKAVNSPLDALWWGIVTLTTVGYGDVYPVTAEGRIAASVLMILGIGLFSAITATITSFMLTGGHETTPTTRLRLLAELHREGLLTDAEYEAKRSETAGDL